jgi:UDP-N-acetylmuramyl pentapeptide phosphotransferase/UDP-N-acetylglucosamine-1-phosphate transferase
LLSAIIFVGACLLSFVLIWALRHVPAARVFVDSPAKPQAMHSQAVPRYGGFGIVGAIVLVATLTLSLRSGPLPSWCLSLGAALTLVGAVSIVDDMRHVPAWLRLCVHALAAAAVIGAVWPAASSLSVGALLLLAAVCVLGVAWSINLFNFMDGVNGMVAVSSAVGFLGLAVIGTPNSLGASPSGVIVLCIATAGAAAGFLPHNLGGRVFMGDLGSTGLGLLAACLALFGVTEALWFWWIPLVVFAPLIVDTSWTLFRRAMKRQPVWQSHREHIYQRLVRLRGWSHLQVTALYGGLTLLGVIAVAVGRQIPLWDSLSYPSLFVVWVLKYVTLVVIAEVHLREVAQS